METYFFLKKFINDHTILGFLTMIIKTTTLYFHILNQLIILSYCIWNLIIIQLKLCKIFTFEIDKLVSLTILIEHNYFCMFMLTTVINIDILNFHEHKKHIESYYSYL